MHLSELINELQAMLDAEGDLKVEMADDYHRTPAVHLCDDTYTRLDTLDADTVAEVRQEAEDGEIDLMVILGHVT